MRQIVESRMEPVQSTTVRVPFMDNGAHVIVEHFQRDAAKRIKGLFVALTQRLELFVFDKHTEGKSTPTQRAEEQ